VDLPNVLNRNGPTELEADTPAASLADALRARGHDPLVIPLTSGLHAIERHGGAWRGGADPRRDGLAQGD
jgi:gamma-glutamyltranspeptidase/glutathione hydrolase